MRPHCFPWVLTRSRRVASSSFVQWWFIQDNNVHCGLNSPWSLSWDYLVGLNERDCLKYYLDGKIAMRNNSSAWESDTWLSIGKSHSQMNLIESYRPFRNWETCRHSSNCDDLRLKGMSSDSNVWKMSDQGYLVSRLSVVDSIALSPQEGHNRNRLSKNWGIIWSSWRFSVRNNRRFSQNDRGPEPGKKWNEMTIGKYRALWCHVKCDVKQGERTFIFERMVPTIDGLRIWNNTRDLLQLRIVDLTPKKLQIVRKSTSLTRCSHSNAHFEWLIVPNGQSAW
jgi:hypothetical protein